VNEQLNLLDAIDEAGGFDEWIPVLPCPPWPLTTAELARRAGCNAKRMETVLRDEERRGHVARDGEGWRVTPSFLHEFGRGFRDFALGSSVEDAA
jgi:hypothetical protein